MYLLICVLYVRITGTPNHPECKIFPLEKGFHHAHVPFTTGFTVNQGLVLRPFFYVIHALTSLTNLHHFLIYALPFFGLTLFGWFISIYFCRSFLS